MCGIGGTQHRNGNCAVMSSKLNRHEAPGVGMEVAL